MKKNFTLLLLTLTAAVIAAVFLCVNRARRGRASPFSIRQKTPCCVAWRFLFSREWRGKLLRTRRMLPQRQQLGAYLSELASGSRYFVNV